MTNVMHKLFSMYLFLFIEENFFQPAHISAANIERQLPEAVLIQFASPGDERDVLETCREL
jgi:hypothetical protein